MAAHSDPRPIQLKVEFLLEQIKGDLRNNAIDKLEARRRHFNELIIELSDTDSVSDITAIPDVPKRQRGTIGSPSAQERQKLNEIANKTQLLLDRLNGSSQYKNQKNGSDVDSNNPPKLTKKKVVFPLHGIRTKALWQKSFADVAQANNWTCRLENWYFGWFSILHFLSPWARSAKIRWFRKNYNQEVVFSRLNVSENQLPSIVVHSFGAYILGNALLKYSNLKFDKVILCGSILPRDFPWDEIIERGQVQAVRNEFGVNDIWAKTVKWFVPNTGPSGALGFYCKHKHLDQEQFRFDHSEFFDEGHMTDNWINFLNKVYPFKPSIKADIPDPKPTYPVGAYILYGLGFYGLWQAWKPLSLLFNW